MYLGIDVGTSEVKAMLLNEQHPDPTISRKLGEYWQHALENDGG